MSCGRASPTRTRISVFMLNDEGQGADELDAVKVVGAPVPFPEGVLYLGGGPTKDGTTPKWLETFFGQEVVDITASMPRQTSGVVLLNVGETRFAVALGKGVSMIAAKALTRQFGLKVAMGVYAPVLFRLRLPVETLACFTDVDGLLNQGMGLGKVLSHSVENTTRPVVKDVTVSPAWNYEPLLGKQVTGGAGLTFEAPGDKSTLQDLVRFMFKVHRDVSANGPPYDGMIAGHRLARVVEYMEYECDDDGQAHVAAPPQLREILYPLLRQVEEAGTEVGPSELYHPVARCLNSTVMFRDHEKCSRKKKAFKKRLRSALRVLDEAELVSRVEVGRYTITPLGQKVSNENVDITQDLLNDLLKEKYQKKLGDYIRK